MHIASYTTRRPVATSMGFLAIILLGMVSFSRLKVDLLPDITFPKLVVWTNYREVGPAEVEEFVTIPLEEAVSTVPGVRRVHSISKDGISLVTVEFGWGTDMDFAALFLREKLDNLTYSLPQTAERPVILRLDPRARPIMTLAVSGNTNLHQLYSLSFDVFKRRLEQIDGVAMATVTGGDRREIQVDVDMALLTAYGLSLSQVEQALRLANDNRTGGSIRKGRYRYSLRTVGEFQSVEDIAATPVRIDIGTNGGTQIRIGEIAKVYDAFRERKGYTLYNGRESIGILVTKESGGNTIMVADKVLEVVGQLRQQYPEIDLAVVDNQASFISAAVSQVRQALILGGILAFIVLFFFLHDLRNPINIAVSMPVSVIATFALMYFAGVSVNMVSLGGLALGIGMLVDNSIVVLENIYRRNKEGLSLNEACVEGTREVSMAITASTLTTIAVFFPIIYISGVAGQLFRDQSLTVSFSLLASLVVAMALLPMVAARWKPTAAGGESLSSESKPSIRPTDQKNRFLLAPFANIPTKALQFLKGLLGYWRNGIAALIHKVTNPIFQIFDSWFDRLYRRYENWLLSALERGRSVLLFSATVFVLALAVGWQLDRRLMPEVEQHRFDISIELPRDATLQATSDLSSLVDDNVRGFPEIEAVFSQIGLIEEDIRKLDARIGVHRAEMNVFLKDGVSTRSFLARVQPELQKLNAGAIAIHAPKTTIGEILGSTLSDLAVEIRGNDPDSAAIVIAAIQKGLEQVSGISQIYSSEDEKRSEIRLVIDRERAADQGVRPREIAVFIEQYMRGTVPTDLRDFDRKIPILLRAGIGHRENMEELLATPILLPNRAVPLSEVVAINELLAPASIEREDQVRQRTLYLSVEGRKLNAVTQDVQDILDSVALPNGFELSLGGQREEMLASFREMIFAFLLAFILVFLILAAQFESLVHPFTIILTIPLAIIGVVIGLFTTGQSLNIMSLIGVVVLVGIVVNDAIIKVDFINQERRKGSDLRRAITLAGQKRLRPIIMTTITTVLALLPMAIGFGEGAELRRPLAIAIIFGISFATTLTLFVVPVMYQLIDRGRADLRQKKK